MRLAPRLQLPSDAGGLVRGRRDTNLAAKRGVAVREFPLKSGHGEAHYLLFVDQMGVGVVEDKEEGETLAQVEPQNQEYSV